MAPKKKSASRKFARRKFSQGKSINRKFSFSWNAGLKGRIMKVLVISMLAMILMFVVAIKAERHAINISENPEQLSFISKSIFAFFIVYFLFVLVYVYFVLTDILSPLRDVSKIAIKVSRREFDVPLFNSESKDEIGVICRAFDKMLVSVSNYASTIREKVRTENELKEKQIEMNYLYASARLSVLQSQINPHFLFNTLNTGVQLAMLEGADKTSDFIEQLAVLFRYNVQDRQYSTIDEELQVIEHFVYIMKVRFGSRLDFEKDIPFGSYPQKLPPMILQPLCENCMKHGLEKQVGKVILKIRRIPGFVEISISNNGADFDPDIRIQILDEVRKGNIYQDSLNPIRIPSQSYRIADISGVGIGLKNVFARLKLFFHRDDIFDIQSDGKGSGTKFIVRVPIYV